MNAPPASLHAPPIGLDVFDLDRQSFLRAFREFMADTSLSTADRQGEYIATLKALSQIAALSRGANRG